MQRVSNVLLSVAMTVCALAISLALVIAAWLMTSLVINGPVLPTFPKWLFVGYRTVTVVVCQAPAGVSASLCDYYRREDAKKVSNLPIVDKTHDADCAP